MYQNVSLPQYLEWRDQTQGGMGTKEVHYELTSISDKDITVSGVIPVTDAHIMKCKTGWYSSVIFAALDSTNFKELLPVQNALKVAGETTISFAQAPTFIVKALDLDEENGGACIKVYVEGRV